MKIEKILKNSAQKTLLCRYRNTVPDIRLAWKEVSGSGSLPLGPTWLQSAH